MAINIFEEEQPIVALTPEGAKGKIKAYISDLLSMAGSLVVTTEDGYKKITSLYKSARECKKAVEAKRKELVEPFRAQTAIINDKAKELSEPLDKIIEIANAKTGSYQKLLEEQKRVNDEETRQAAALFGDSDIYIAPLEKTIRGDGAMAITKTVKKFRLSDINKVPMKYLMLNEKAIELDIKLGLSEIAGLEIYEEQTTQLRVR